MWELVLDEAGPPAVPGSLLPWPGWHPVQGECREELIYGNRRTDLALEDEHAELVSALLHPETSLISVQLPSWNSEQTGVLYAFSPEPDW